MAPGHMSGEDAATLLIVPALCDQLIAMCKMVKENAFQNPKVPYCTHLGLIINNLWCGRIVIDVCEFW